ATSTTTRQTPAPPAPLTTPLPPAQARSAQAHPRNLSLLSHQNRARRRCSLLPSYRERSHSSPRMTKSSQKTSRVDSQGPTALPRSLWEIVRGAAQSPNLCQLSGHPGGKWVTCGERQAASDPSRTKGTAFCCDAHPLIHSKPAIPRSAFSKFESYHAALSSL